MRKTDTQTIREVARQAGVSPATVSRVMNGTARVSLSKSQVVLDTVRRLGYSPSPMARSLSMGRTNLVGVLVPDFGGAFYWPVLSGIMSSLEEISLKPLLGLGSWNLEREQEMVEYFHTQKVEAVVVLGSAGGSGLFSNSAMPVVSFGGKNDANIFPLTADNELAGYDATNYLINHNHQNIVHLTSARAGGDIEDRRKGYARAMREANLEPRILNGNLLAEDGVRLAALMFEKWPDTTAVFSADDLMAFGVLSYAHRVGISVPNDLSVIGFDDMWMSNYSSPPLTTIRQPVEEIGRTLGRAVGQILAGQSPVLPQYRLTLVERSSVRFREES